MATYVGFHIKGILGGLAAPLSLVLPSVIIIVIISKILDKFKSSSIVQNALYGLRAASTALIAAAGITALLGHWIDTGVILGVVIINAIIGFIQEGKAEAAIDAIRAMLAPLAFVIRDGQRHEIAAADLVPGDIVRLSAGDMVPADIRLIESRDLFVSQAALTGESLPVEKVARSRDPQQMNPLECDTLCFMGTTVVSGTAQAIVTATGGNTWFGQLAGRVSEQESEPNAFQKGIGRVSMLLIRFMMVMTPIVLLINGYTKGDWWEAALFALSVAVGLTPEMLPMIVTSTLARGAVKLSKQKVIVKHLDAIQNFGAMDILCTDKTGTLTQDKIVLENHTDISGKTSERVLHSAWLNSHYQTGLKNLLDLAVLEHLELRHALRVALAQQQHLAQAGQHALRKPQIIHQRARHQAGQGTAADASEQVLAKLVGKVLVAVVQCLQLGGDGLGRFRSQGLGLQPGMVLRGFSQQGLAALQGLLQLIAALCQALPFIGGQQGLGKGGSIGKRAGLQRGIPCGLRLGAALLQLGQMAAGLLALALQAGQFLLEVTGDVLERLAGVVVVEVVGGFDQLARRVVAVGDQQVVLHVAQRRDQDQQDALFRQAQEFDLPERGIGPLRRDDHAGKVGEVGQKLRGSRSHAQRAVRMDAAFDLAQRLLFQRVHGEELVHEHPVAARSGHPAGRGVRTGHQPHVFQLGHDVADRGRADVEA
mgnify:CR=1 FL=1